VTAEREPGAFLDMPLREALAEIAAPRPTATAGAVCAVTTAAAAALVEMTARLSDGAAGAAAAGALRSRAESLVDEDAAAYARVLEAQRRTGVERREALREAFTAAAQPPLRIARAAAEVAVLAERVVGAAERAVCGDAATAASLAAAAARSATRLARVNLAAAGGDLDAAAAGDAASAAAAEAADSAWLGALAAQE